jgi:hypothetical protein
MRRFRSAALSDTTAQAILPPELDVIDPVDLAWEAVRDDVRGCTWLAPRRKPKRVFTASLDPTEADR